MAQFARPDADSALSGAWTNQAAGTTNLWQAIDEATASNTDYVQSPTNPDATVFYECSLSNVTDPQASTAHTVRYRLGKDSTSGRTINVDVQLRQGTTVIAQWTHSNIDAVTQYQQTLTSVQADAITDYADLRFRFNPTTTGGGAARASRITWIEFETPDAPATPVTATVAQTLPALTQDAVGSVDAGGTYFFPGTQIESPNVMGPFVDGNGNLYFLDEFSEPDPTWRMRKSTDGGQTWAEAGAASRPVTNDLESVDIVQVGTRLHISLCTDLVQYVVFAMSDDGTSPDSYVVDETVVAGPFDHLDFQQSSSLVVRSDGTAVIFYNRPGASFDALRYQIRSAGGTWSGELTVDAASEHFNSVTTILANNDVTWIFYFSDSGVIYYRTLSAADSLSARATAASGIDTSASMRWPMLPPVRWMSGADEKIMLVYANNDLTPPRLLSTVFTNGSGPATAKTVNPSAGLAIGDTYGSSQPVATAAVDADTGTVHVLWGSSVDRDLYRTSAVDDGGWAAETEVHDGISAYWVRGRVFTRNGQKTLGYVVDEEPAGGTDLSFYAALDLGTAAVEAVVAQTLPALAQAAAGTSDALTWTAGSVILSGTVTATTVTASSAQTLPALTQDAVGAVEVAATVAQTLPLIAQDAAGSVQQGSVYDPTMVTAHSIELSGLTPSTTYRYRVRSRDGAGNLVESGWQTFTTTDSTHTVDFSTVVRDLGTQGATFQGVVSSTYGTIPDPAGTADEQAQAIAERSLDARYWRIPVRWNGTNIATSAAGAGSYDIEPVISLYHGWGHRLLLVIGGRTDDFNGYQSGDALAIVQRLKVLFGSDLSMFDLSGPNEPSNQGATIGDVVTRNTAIYDEIQPELAGRKVWGPVWAFYDNATFDTYLDGMGATRHAGVDYHNYAMGLSWLSTADAFAQTTDYATQIAAIRADAVARGIDDPVNVDELNYSWRYADGTPLAEGGDGSGNNLRFFTAISTVWHASANGHGLKAGARMMPYATQNGPLGVMVQPGEANPDGRPAQSPMPAYWGIAAWTGAGAPVDPPVANWPHMSRRFYATGSSDALTEVFAVDNEAGGYNVILINKRENDPASVHLSLSGLAGSWSYQRWYTRKTNPYDAPLADAQQPWSGPTVVNMGPCSYNVLVLEPA